MTASLGNFQNGSYGSNLDASVYPQFLFDPRRAPTARDVFNPGTQWQDNSASPPIIYITTGAGRWAALPTATVFSTLTVTGIALLEDGINSNPVVQPAGVSPRTANGRSGQVTFSGVSIPAGTTRSFVINNTAIPAASTVILYSMVGSTTGSALSIQSVTNIANTSSTIVVTNGTGAVAAVGNLTFTFLLLN